MDFPELETKRIKLVQVVQEHANAYYDIMSRDDVTVYYGMDSLESEKQAVEMIDSFHSTFEMKRGIRWGILSKDTGGFIGTLGLNNLNIKGKKAEIGYELHPSYWGKGITTEAVTKVLQYSFEDLDLFRIGAVTYPQNEPSIQLLKKLGFSQEGLLRGYLYQRKQSHDALVFSLLKPEWIDRGNTLEV